MQVLIVNDQVDRQVELAIAFIQSGFQTTSTSSQLVAESCIRRGTVDLLVIAERVGGQLAHSLALLAEYRNPMVVTMLLTDRTDQDLDELYLLLPSLHCILSPRTAPELMTRLAVASVTGAEEIKTPMLLVPSLRIDDSVGEDVDVEMDAIPCFDNADDPYPVFASIRGPLPEVFEMRQSG